jgi:uroporphyrinogen decarboxylase
MTILTSHERMKRMYEHRDADRIPVTDYPWGATLQRWHNEGMPTNVDYADYFGLDKIASFGADNSPRYPATTIEDTDEYTIFTSGWGATMKQTKQHASTPDFVDFIVKDPETWKDAKSRMTPGKDRIDWKSLEKNYKYWRENNYWINAGFWFGFDITHSWFIGTETILMALIEEPEWCIDMFNTELDMNIALTEMMLEAGYEFDAISWPDDMGYKYHTFFSVNTYREILKPVHKRAIDWAHSKKMKAFMHSCGDIRTFLPELIDIELDALNPLEVKAGMDPVKIKAEYGDKLVLCGGLNAVSFDNMDIMEAEMRSVLPSMKQNGGYICSSDHSVPETVSLEDFKRFVSLAKELGSY